MICQKRVFLLNNVYFDQKLVSLGSNIRLLKRDGDNRIEKMYRKHAWLMYQQKPT